MKSKTVIVFVIALILGALAFSGCSANITVAKSEFSGNNFSYTITVEIPKETVILLESGKGGSDKETVSVSNGTRSLKDYMQKLSDISKVDSYEHGYDKNGAYLYVAQITTSDNLFAPSTKYEEVVKQEGWFFNSYTVTVKNPFAKAFEDYDNANLSYKTKDSSEYIVYLLAKGSKQDGIPAFYEYFKVDKKIGDGVVCEFLLQRRLLMQSDAQVVIFNNADYFSWETTVDDTNDSVVYSFKGVNTYAWYITIIGLGVVVALVLWLVAKKSKKTPALNDETEIVRKRLAYKKMRQNGVNPAMVREQKIEPNSEEKTNASPFEEDEK